MSSGCDVEVWRDGCFYPATVKKSNEETKSQFLRFHNGDKQWLDMVRQMRCFVGPLLTGRFSVKAVEKFKLVSASRLKTPLSKDSHEFGAGAVLDVDMSAPVKVAAVLDTEQDTKPTIMLEIATAEPVPAAEDTLNRASSTTKPPVPKLVLPSTIFNMGGPQESMLSSGRQSVSPFDGSLLGSGRRSVSPFNGSVLSPRSSSSSLTPRRASSLLAPKAVLGSQEPFTSQATRAKSPPTESPNVLFRRLLSTMEPTQVESALDALLCHGQSIACQAVLVSDCREADGVACLLSLLGKFDDFGVQGAVCKILGLLAEADAQLCATVVELGGIPAMVRVVKDSRKGVRDATMTPRGTPRDGPGAFQG